jgi:hypothetical protein
MKETAWERRKVNAVPPMDCAKQQEVPNKFKKLDIPWKFWAGSVDLKSANGKKAPSCVPASLPASLPLSLVAKPGIGPVKLRFNLMFGCSILAAVELSGGGGTAGHLLPGCSFQRLRSASAHL